MARRKREFATGIVAEAFRSRGVGIGASVPEPAHDNLTICGQFGISKGTLKRWREKRGFPMPDFVVGLREFTWQRRIVEWTEQQPKVHPLHGKHPTASAEAEAA